MMPQRLSSMHSKVRQIHIQLQQPASSNAAAEEQPSSSNNKGPLLKLAAKLAGKDGLRCCLRKQLFFAQCLKLLALFSVAIAHVLFLHPFLELFSQLDEYMARVEVAIRQQPPPTSGVGGANLLRHSVHDLADYKKNVWMTVSVLCVALSTSSFFLFLLPSSSPLRKRYIYLIGLVDAVSFGCLPILFHARAFIVQRVREQLGHALVEAHRISSAEKLMNEAQCSIQPREKMPFCSERILRSVFPVDLLKFLLVLCVMTLAYLLVAYIIYWCVKHWVPHSDANCTKFCHCCISQHKKSLLAANYTPLGQFDFPRPLVLLPNPLMAVPSTQCSPASQTQDEESTEPVPTIVTN